jgi:hypothetical protein
MPATTSEPRTEPGRIMLEWTQEHFRGVHDTAHPELPEQFRAIEDESWNAALTAAYDAIWEHGLFVDYESGTVSCGCGKFAGTMPFMQHIQDAAIASLRLSHDS